MSDDRIDYDENKELDEVVLTARMVHIERMSNGRIWVGVYREDGDTFAFTFTTESDLYWEMTEGSVGSLE